MFTLRRMIRVLASLLILLPFVFQPATIASAIARGGQGTGAAVLTNDDVMKMVQAKLADGIIVAKVKSSACRFDTSTDSLIKLKGAGVSDAVLEAMAGCGAAPATVNAPPTPMPSAAGPVSEIGVYTKVGDEWKQVDPEVVNVKSGGVGKSLLSAGLVKPDVNAHLNGAHSGNRVRTPVEFLIYMAEGVGITEYQLIHLHEQKDSREFRTVTGGVMHVSSGATRDLIQFEGKKIANRTYVIELGNIGGGEYGFLPPGAVLSSSGGSVGKMYTFSVLE
ncbi:MAG: hypothetical protein ACLQVG_12500 [Terriglobia bacterium]